MDLRHLPLTQETLEQADSDRASVLSSSMRTMSSRFTGLGADTGRAIEALGSLMLRGVDAIASWRRVRALSSTFKEDGRIGRLADENVNDLFELQRLGVYPSRIQKQAMILILRAADASPDYFNRVLQSLLQLPKWDIKDFLLFQMPQAFLVKQPWLSGVHGRLTTRALIRLLDSKLDGAGNTFDLNNFASLVGGITQFLVPEELVDASSERLTDMGVDNLFKLRRPELCPLNIQGWATRLILRTADVSEDHFGQVLQSLLRLPKEDIKDFLLLQLPDASLVKQPTLFLAHVNLTTHALSVLLNPKPGTTDYSFDLDDFALAFRIADLPSPASRLGTHHSKEIRPFSFRRTCQAGNNERNFRVALALVGSGWAERKEMASKEIWGDEWRVELRYAISSLVSLQVVDHWSDGVIREFLDQVGWILKNLHYRAIVL